MSYCAATLLQSSLILFMCELGAYWYCVTAVSVRPPVEGIPFFRASVFTLSVVVMGAFYSISIYVGFLAAICRRIIGTSIGDGSKQVSTLALEKMPKKLVTAMIEGFSRLQAIVSPYLKILPSWYVQLINVGWKITLICAALYVSLVLFIEGVKQLAAAMGRDAAEVILLIVLVTLGLCLWKKAYSAGIRIVGGTVLAVYISSFALNPDLVEDFLYDLALAQHWWTPAEDR